MAVFRGCCCCRERKVDWVINSSAICFMWVSIVCKFFIADHCRERHYSFQIRRCHDEGCCPTPEREWAWLPDPILDITGQHYKPFDELLGKETTDKDRPSSLKQTVAAVAQEQQGCKNSILVGQNVRQTVNCCECLKPRCIYAKTKLTARDQRALTHTLEKYDYTCGSVITPDGEICYHDNQVQPVLPSLLIMSALSQLFLVAVAISIAVDSYRNNAKSITIFIFLLNIIVIILGLIFVLKGWNSPQMDSANIIPVVTQLTPLNETDSSRNLSIKHLSYSVPITTFPTTKASTEHSVPEKRDFHSHKKSCRDLILVCATIAFPVDGLLTVSLIVLFIFSVKIKDTQDISQGFHEDEIPLLESIENKRILKEE